MSQRSDDIHLRQIVDGFLRGDSVQFQIVRRQIARLINHWWNTGAAERDDLVADTLKTLLENLRAGQFRGDSVKAFNSYVFGITRFKVMHAISRARTGAQSQDPGLLDELPHANAPNPHLDSAHRQLLDKVFAALNQTCRELLELKFSLGWSDQEIADHRKMTKNAVSTAISRCIRRAQSLDFVREILYQKPRYGHYES